MARPLKKGLDYFPMDTKLDMKLQLLKAKYKLEGIGFVDLLYRTIYNEGYYIKLDEDSIIMLSAEFGITEEKFNEMLNFCLDKDIFYKPFYDKNKIITSGGIQKRYFHKTTRRQDQNYVFLMPDITNGNSVNDDNNDDDDDNEEVIATNRYVKESKVNKRKVKKTKIKLRESVSLSQDEINKLIEKYGKEFTEKCFDKLDNYKMAKGTKYKSDYRAILNWVVDAIKERGSNGKGTSTKRSANFVSREEYESELKQAYDLEEREDTLLHK